MSLMNFIRAAVPMAATARTGYLQGQDQEHDKQDALARQSLLDQMKQAMDQSTMDENASRARYYDNVGNAKADPPDTYKPFTGTAEPTLYNPKTGEIKSPTDANGVPLPGKSKAAQVKEVGVYNPADDTVSDVLTDGTRANTRKATMVEKMKFNHIPRDPNDAPPMNTRTEEETAQALAKSAVDAVGGDPVKAMAWMESSGEYPKAKAAGMTRRHYYQAAANYKADQAKTAAAAKRESFLYGGSDVGADAAAGLGITPPGGTARSATPPSRGNVSLPAAAAKPAAATQRSSPPSEGGDSGAGAFADLAASPRIQAVVQAVREKRATINDVDGSTRMTPAEKAAVHRLLVGGTN